MGVIRMQADRAARDRGAAAAVVAVSMLFLLGLSALIIDGSNLYRERGDAQNAVDHSALAAAFADCNGGMSPSSAGLLQAQRNGFTHDGVRTVVTIVQEGSNWRSTITSTIDGYFSKILGVSTLTTRATALASCTTAVVGGYALFAGGVCGPDTLDWSGSDNTVTGGVHSNDGIDVSGSTNAVFGDTTSVNGLVSGGSGNTFTPTEYTTSQQAWPQIFDVLDFLPPAYGGNGSVEAAVGSSNYHFVDGKIDSGELLSRGWLSGTTLDPGVYVATEDIDLSISDLTGTVTFVSAPATEGKGIITLSGSDQDLDPFYQSLLLFSDSWKGSPGYPWNPLPPNYPDCFDPAVKLSGSNQSWTGIMFAPRGMVDLSGSTNVSVDGSIISYTIRIGGSSQQITFSGGGGGSDPVLELVE